MSTVKKGLGHPGGDFDHHSEALFGGQRPEILQFEFPFALLVRLR